MARTLIHFGMPRTASTLFQQEVFPAMEGFTHVPVAQAQYSLAFQQMMYQDGSLFDPSAFAAATAPLRDGNVVLSNELFIGQSLYLNATNRSRNAARLAAAFPGAEAILILRYQPHLLRSLYSIGVYAGHTMPPEAFVNFGDGAHHPPYATFGPAEQVENYLYTSVVELLQRHFTKVHLFLFEDFQADPQAFLHHFAERLGITYSTPPDTAMRVNSSLSVRQINLLRRLNPWRSVHEITGVGARVFRHRVRFVERYLRGRQPFRFGKALEAKLYAYYRADNEALLRKWPGLDANGHFTKVYLSPS